MHSQMQAHYKLLKICQLHSYIISPIETIYLHTRCPNLG